MSEAKASFPLTVPGDSSERNKEGEEMGKERTLYTMWHNNAYIVIGLMRR